MFKGSEYSDFFEACEKNYREIPSLKSFNAAYVYTMQTVRDSIPIPPKKQFINYTNNHWKKKDTTPTLIADINEMKELTALAEKRVPAEALKNFHTAETLDRLAWLLSARVVQWIDTPTGETRHLKTASDVRMLISAMLDCIKTREVIAGRVSDRVAEEVHTTAEELKANSKREAVAILHQIHSRVPKLTTITERRDVSVTP